MSSVRVTPPPPSFSTRYDRGRRLKIGAGIVASAVLVVTVAGEKRHAAHFPHIECATLLDDLPTEIVVPIVASGMPVMLL